MNSIVKTLDGVRLYACWMCQGQGYREWYRDEHDSNCDGFNCSSCPIQVPTQDPCEDCAGSSLVIYKHLKQQVLHDVPDNLRAIEILEAYKYGRITA